MRILYLGDQHFDYVSDPLYIGLSRVVGNEAVLDYPYKALYHEAEARNWFMAQRPGHKSTHEEVAGLLRDRTFDLAVVASFRPDCLDEFARLHAKVPFPPLVFIDGADDAEIRRDLAARYPFRLYFKRDYVWGLWPGWTDLARRAWSFGGDRRLAERTVPLPLSLIPDVLPDVTAVEKDIDVSYTGRASHPRRAQVIEILRGMQDIRFEGGLYADPGDRRYKLIGGRLSRLRSKLLDNRPAAPEDQSRKKTGFEYYREIARSKIAVAIRGGGFAATPRYYEIAALGTMLLSDPPETVIPHDFADGQHAVYCRADLRDVERLVRRYVHDDAARQAIAEAGRRHVLAHHTCERRAEYFLEMCRRWV